MIRELKITGGTPLHGEVRISGAKNSATKLMIASLLTSDPVTLKNVPKIGDIDITQEICEQVGTKVKRQNHTMTLHTPKITEAAVTEQTRKNRLSVLALGPLLHRSGEAFLPIVGGDAIGPRPVNYHLEALKKMGADIEETDEGYRAVADELHGAEISLPYPSVGATENIIFSAVLAKGKTTIRNAAKEPEVHDIIMMLQQMGAIIELGANRQIFIEGVKRLNGVEYSVMPDRLEAASYAALAIATDGEIKVIDAHQRHLLTFLNTIRRMNAGYFVNGDGITFRRESGGLKGTDITTDTWPGFSTDWQQPVVVALTQAEGRSVIHETVYQGRFGYTDVLNKMGADISIFDARKSIHAPRALSSPHYNESARIKGPTPLHATEMEMPDIRAGMTYVIAALTAEGTSRITGIHHLLRGYDHVLEKLESIGAQFESIEEPN